ncbi:MAG: glycosyltransferase family 39 protein, partial [Gemmatimonadaceae bacterium]|nr:glycosyltransferase family 39 protein [Gemmatimonadaceae bacterium]
MTSSPPSFSASSGAAGTHASDLDATAEARGLTWRSYAGLPVLLLALHAVLAWIGRSPGILTRQDDTRYLMLARALRHGQYRDLMWPDAPPHHLYPPGYPALLALWTAIGGEGFDWLVSLHVLMSVATLALAFLAMRKAFGPTVVLCALAVLAVNPSLLEWSGQVASESALALAIALAVYAATCLPEGTAKHTALALAALSAPFMRTAGIVVPVAVVLYYVAERQYKRALVFAVCSALVLVPLLWWTLNDPYAVVGSSYAAD